jgi:predicted dehydrogenase
VEVAALCDCDTARVDNLKARYPNASACVDMRELIDDPGIDAVVISTTNQWHALAGIWACQAGKDVYVEKPVSHTIWEGRKLVEAARKYGRIVQGGTQQRSNGYWQELREAVHGGEYGDILYARCNRYGRRGSIGKRETPLAAPQSCDYDLWLGPAADLPIMRKKFHYDWHWDWNAGNGELGNWGPHLLDDLRNVVFQDQVAYPKRVVSGGGRLAWNDAGASPNTHFVYMETDTVPVIVDVHNLPRQKGLNADDIYWRRRTPAFLVVEMEGGYYAGGRNGGSIYDHDGKKIRSFSGDGGGGHAENFIAAVRSRRKEELTAEIEQNHYSSAWCHLGNIAYRLGEGAAYERKAAEAVVDCQPWRDVISDFHEHLKRNEIDPAGETITLGPTLDFDGEKETFVGESATPEALALLTREYRSDFQVPAEV